MGILQTAERSTKLDPSENVIFQRHLIAYKEAAKLIKGTVLEIGSGEGYGIKELAPLAEKYIAVDKYNSHIEEDFKLKNNISFVQAEHEPNKTQTQALNCCFLSVRMAPFDPNLCRNTFHRSPNS